MFNQKMFFSIGNAVKGILTEQNMLNERKMTAQRALSIQRNAEKKQRKAERQEFQAELDAAIETAGGNRQQVLDAWAKDPEKQKRAQALGLGKIGKHEGDGSAGMVRYRVPNANAVPQTGKGKIITVDSNFKGPSINSDGSFNLTAEQQRVAAENRAAMAAAREQDAAGQSSQGGQSSRNFTVGRGVGGTPIITYTADTPREARLDRPHPQSGEGLVRAAVERGEVPAHILEPKKLQIDLDKEREKAMDDASQRVLGFDARGMTPEQKRERLLQDIDNDFKSREAKLMNKSINMNHAEFNNYMEREFPGHMQRELDAYNSVIQSQIKQAQTSSETRGFLGQLRDARQAQTPSQNEPSETRGLLGQLRDARQAQTPSQNEPSETRGLLGQLRDARQAQTRRKRTDAEIQRRREEQAKREQQYADEMMKDSVSAFRSSNKKPSLPDGVIDTSGQLDSLRKKPIAKWNALDMQAAFNASIIDQIGRATGQGITDLDFQDMGAELRKEKEKEAAKRTPFYPTPTGEAPGTPGSTPSGKAPRTPGSTPFYPTPTGEAPRTPRSRLRGEFGSWRRTHQSVVKPEKPSSDEI